MNFSELFVMLTITVVEAVRWAVRRAAGGRNRLERFVDGTVRTAVHEVGLGVKSRRARIALKAMIIIGYAWGRPCEIKRQTDYYRMRLQVARDAVERRRVRLDVYRRILQLCCDPEAAVAYAAIAVPTSLFAVVVAGATSHDAAGVGHMATALVALLVLSAISDRDGKENRLVVLRDPRELNLLLARVLTGGGAAVALIHGTGWTGGSTVGHQVGTASLACALVGGLAPIGRPRCGKRVWTAVSVADAALFILGGVLSTVATGVELVSLRSATGSTVVATWCGNVSGALAFLVAGFALAIAIRMPSSGTVHR